MAGWTSFVGLLAGLLTVREVKKSVNYGVTFGPNISAGKYDAIYQKYGKKYNVDWKLIKAIALTESSERPGAINPNDPSYGLMQVLCSGGEVCTNKFPAIPNWNGMTRTKLLNPEINVDIAAQILRSNINAYGTRKAVAVYNKWGARNESEPFSNQSYVNKVFNYYKAL